MGVEARKQKTSWPEPTTEQPDMEELQESAAFEDTFEATDGCMVEPDGVCHHGHPSWLLKMGMI
jgi:hypothetical protein